MHANSNLAKMVAVNDSERVPFLMDGDEKKAEDIAKIILAKNRGGRGLNVTLKCA